MASAVPYFDGSGVKHWRNFGSSPVGTTLPGQSVGSTCEVSGVVYGYTGTAWETIDPAGDALSKSGTFVDERLLRADSTTGAVQSSTIAVTDAGAVSGITTLATTSTITQNGQAVLDAATDIAAKAYTPTVGADWPNPDPTTIQSGLDKLAERLTDEEAKIVALGAENADVQIVIPVGMFADPYQVLLGNVVYAVTSAYPLQSVGNNWSAVEFGVAQLPLRSRTTASKGIKIRSYVIAYQISVADIDDVQFVLRKRVTPADGATIPAATVIAGAVDGEYDANHNTAAKRGEGTATPVYHTATVTVAAPAYVAAGEVWELAIILDTSATGVFYLGSVTLNCSETLTDLS